MKKALCIMMFLVFCIPLIQYKTKIFKRAELHNFNTKERHPILNYKKYVANKYQGRFETYFLKNSGLYEILTKFNNSINYRFFHLASGKYDQTVMGKDYSLFERIHLMDLNGINNYSTAHLSKLMKIKRLQDHLESKGKNFVLVINPSKALFSEELIPETFKVNNAKPRAIVAVDKLLDKLNINHINLADYLPKNSFTHSGAHLNSFAKCKSVELVSNYVNSRFQIFPEFSCTETGTKEASGEDLDLGRLINVLSYRKSLRPVPDYTIKVTKEVIPLKTLLVGTSFGFGILEEFQKVKAFSSYDFLFYDKTLYRGTDLINKPQRHRFNQSIKHHNIEYVDNFDLVIMEVTEPRINQLGSTFLKNLKL